MKKRLDLILFELGYFETKNKASAAIIAGDIKIDTEVVKKAGEMFDFETFKEKIVPKLEVKKEKFVSRGGLKLEHALNEFKIDIKDKICFDAGASTGGFTDCMLQSGAKEIWSVDCGYNQIDWKIKTNPKVHNIEKTNLKNCTFKEIYGVEELPNSELPSFLSMDLSFISIKKVLENILNFVSENAEMVLLIKPQFEAERCDILKGGIVKDEKVHQKIIEDIKEFAKNLGLETKGITKSPILGNKSGNTEYLIYLKRGKNGSC
ncbi:MAG: TlyA family RNA methyltransferase [Cyanobacteria bacterium SIG30]|nr:TlyA family RNA methyltransferase [Cyanobacteria bacterium SIG30]